MNRRFTNQYGNNNIVCVLNQGWLQGNLTCYFFDLELCALDLNDYMSGDFKSVLGLSAFWDPQFAEDQDLGCLTIWKIMDHISNGLKFIHDNQAVHRDLKPSNGSFKRGRS